MIKNYFVTALRALLKQKLFALINIIGLAVGLAAGILIMLFVRYETSYETWLPNANGIYQMQSVWKRDAEPTAQAPWMPGPLRQALLDNYPEITDVVRSAPDTITLERGEALFSEFMARVDPGYFDMFQFELVKGDFSQVLSKINVFAMNETLAKKYFGDEDPIGQNILVNGSETYTVGAIFKDLPQNTELEISLLTLLDIPSIKFNNYYDEWGSQVLQTYLTLEEGTDIELLNNSFDEFVTRVHPTGDPEEPRSNYWSMVALSVADLHLMASTGGEYMPGGGLRTVYTFSIVALLVVGVAIFNFVNSSTAIAQLRAKEVAMRKTLGAGRHNLVMQFMSEFALLCTLSFILALILVEIFLPSFSAFWDKPITANYFEDPQLLLGILLLFPIIVLCAGYYPAVYLTKFNPSKILMDNKTSGGKGGLRQVLVIMQFSVSIGLAIVATIIHLQFQYATSQELGFNKENKILLRGVGSPITREGYKTLKFELENISGVNGVTRSFYAIGDGNNSSRGLAAEWLEERSSLRIAPVDFNYFGLFDIKILAGRDFNESFANDLYVPSGVEEVTKPANVILNQAALTRLEIATPEDAIGRTFYLDGDDGRAEMTIVGVIEDYKSMNVRERVRSAVYFVDQSKLYNGMVSVAPNSLPEVLGKIETTWKEIFPNVPFVHQFIDEKLNELYAPAQRRSQMLFGFAILSVIISALGLFGLASFTVSRRTKEVGIRKVLGASSGRITRMMIGQFSIPILLANLIAWPVAWYLANDWLQSFSYRVDIEAWVFVIYGVGALLLSWITVGGHAWSVSKANPILALRYE